MNKEEKEKLLADLMRLILFRQTHKHPIRKDEIRKLIFKDLPTTQTKGLANLLLKEAARRFESLFSYSLVEVTRFDRDKNVYTDEGTGVFILYNRLPSSSNFLTFTETQTSEHGFLMVVLALIELSPQKTITSDQLYDHLKSLGFETTGPGHSEIANWQKLLDVEFPKQLYLERKKVTTTSLSQSAREENAVWDYRQGPRAHFEIGTENINTFIATIFGDLPNRNNPNNRSRTQNQEDEQDEEGARRRGRRISSSQSSIDETPRRSTRMRG